MESKKKFKPNPDLKLIDQVKEVLRSYHYALPAATRGPEPGSTVIVCPFDSADYADSGRRASARGRARKRGKHAACRPVAECDRTQSRAAFQRCFSAVCFHFKN